MSTTRDAEEAAITKKNKLDPFLESMTFAHGVMRDCDCDECGLEPVPPDVREAIRKHKRAKLMSVVEITRQERSLVARDGGLSIWHLKYPVGAEPMVEYGDSHRIVLVDKIPSSAGVKKIGTGIVGSSAEEKGRQWVEWEKGRAYLIPSNGGKAVGWVAVAKEEDTKVSSSGDRNGARDPVEVYMLKAASDALKESDEANELQSWAQQIRAIFKEELEESLNESSSREDSYSINVDRVPLLLEQVKMLTSAKLASRSTLL